MDETGAAMVIIFLWFGGMKFTAYEAAGIAPFIEHSPIIHEIKLDGYRMQTGSLAVVGFLFLLVLLTTPTLLAAREPETVKCRYGREQFRPALPAAGSAKPRKRRAESSWKRSRCSPNSLSQ